MSTKIYDGMLVERSLSLADLRELSAALRPKLEAHVEGALTAAAGLAAARAHDRAFAGLGVGGASEPSPMRVAMGMLEEQREREAKGASSWLPMSFEARLFDIGEGRTLAVGFGAKGLREIFAKEVGALPHGYWDNTDPEEGVGEEDWERRKKDWERALGEGMEMGFSEAGVGVSLVGTKYAQWWGPDTGQVAAAAPSKAERARALAMEFMEEAELAGRAAARAAAGEDPSKVGWMGGARREFREWAKGAGVEAVRAMASLVEGGLPELGEAELAMGWEAIRERGKALATAMSESRELAREVAPGHGRANKRGL